MIKNSDLAGDARVVEQRLLSPDQAATYLGLGSRWAVRRLIVNGQLQAVRLAGKLRLDREDLDRFISELKSGRAGAHTHDSQRPTPPGKARLATQAPAELAPLRRRRPAAVTER